jgi:hypothetical protein
MVRGRVVFCEVVGKVGRTGSPVDLELLLADAVLYPVESHVHGLRFLFFDLFVGKSICGGVVNLYRGGWLWVFHFS